MSAPKKETAIEKKALTDPIPFYPEIRDLLLSDRRKAVSAVNFAMVDAYWNIGRIIVEKQGGSDKAKYGTGLITALAKQMTKDFGLGFTAANVKNMRQFHLTFPNGYALRSELGWTHYRSIMRVKNPAAKAWHTNEAVDEGWSARALERQISVSDIINNETATNRSFEH